MVLHGEKLKLSNLWRRKKSGLLYIILDHVSIYKTDTEMVLFQNIVTMKKHVLKEKEFLSNFDNISKVKFHHQSNEIELFTDEDEL